LKIDAVVILHILEEKKPTKSVFMYFKRKCMCYKYMFEKIELKAIYECPVLYLVSKFGMKHNI